VQRRLNRSMSMCRLGCGLAWAESITCYMGGPDPPWEGQFWWIRAPIVKYRHFLPYAVQKRLNLSICRFDCGVEWAEGCTSSIVLIVFARWRQCALVERHVAVTCRMTLNHPSTAAMRLMAKYFDHLLSLDTPTYTVPQIAKRFEPSTVLWAFHTIQPSTLCLKKRSQLLIVCNFNLFSKCLHCWKAYEICFKAYTRLPISL